MTFSYYFLILLIVVLSMDAFAAGFSYGIEKVRVPFLSLTVIALLSGGMLTASLLAGNLLMEFIPEALTKGISFTVLFLLSLYKFYDALPCLHGGSRKLTDRKPAQGNHAKDNYAQDNYVRGKFTTDTISQKVNKEDKAVLSCREGAVLAIALSIDNISAGLCTGTVSLPSIILLLLTTAIHFFALRLGVLTGGMLSHKSQGFAWLGGAILLVLAFLRLV